MYKAGSTQERRDWNNNSDMLSLAFWAEKTLLWPRDLQSEKSCHSSRSWRCQRPPAGGWHWWFDLLESPAKTRAVLTSEAPDFLRTPTVLVLTLALRLTCILPEVASSFFFSPVTAIVAKYWMTRLVFTVFPAPDSPLSNRNSVYKVPKLAAIAAMRRKHNIYLRDQDWLILSVYKKEIIHI